MYRAFLFFLILFCLKDIYLCIDCDVDDHNEESRILQDIFCNGYDSTVRPVKSHKTTTVVSVEMVVKSYDFNDYSSTLTVNVWMINNWEDEFLVWDPLKYNNIKVIDASSNLIWRPDFALYNADISFGIGSCHETNCIIEHTGNVTCVEPCSYTGHCKSNFNLWPYDRQNCTMIFGPWMNYDEEIDYHSKAAVVTTTGAAQHTQWKLISGSVVKKVYNIVSKDNKYSSKFPNLIYFFIIERHSSLPSKIIMASVIILISINILVFLVDTDSHERISLLALNLLLHFQMIHQISWMLPHQGDTVPRTLVFFRSSLLITCSTLIESLLMKFISSCQRTPPEWMKNFIFYVRRKQLGFIFLEREEDNETHDESVLIEATKPLANSSKKFWRDLCSIVDRILIFIITVLYFIMALTLIPFRYATNENQIKVEN